MQKYSSVRSCVSAIVFLGVLYKSKAEYTYSYSA